MALSYDLKLYLLHFGGSFVVPRPHCSGLMVVEQLFLGGERNSCCKRPYKEFGNSEYKDFKTFLPSFLNLQQGLMFIFPY